MPRKLLSKSQDVFPFWIKCDWQSTSSFVTQTQMSRNKTPSEEASVQNKSSWAFWEKSYLLSVLVKKGNELLRRCSKWCVYNQSIDELWMPRPPALPGERSPPQVTTSPAVCEQCVGCLTTCLIFLWIVSDGVYVLSTWCQNTKKSDRLRMSLRR